MLGESLFNRISIWKRFNDLLASYGELFCAATRRNDKTILSVRVVEVSTCVSEFWRSGFRVQGCNVSCFEILDSSISCEEQRQASNPFNLRRWPFAAYELTRSWRLRVRWILTDRAAKARLGRGER